MRVRYLLFGGIDTRRFDALVDGANSYVWPERDYDTLEIPGRSGELTMDNGRFRNIEVPYTLLFKSVHKMEGYRAEMMALTSYQRLEDARQPETFQVARLKGGFSPKIAGVGNRTAEVTLTFDCKPQRFLKSGEQPITLTESGGELVNEGFPALPLITVTGGGEGGLTIGGVTVSFKAGFSGPVVLDCESQNAYYGPVNMNNQISAPSFPTLPHGRCTVSWTGGVDGVTIVPRWWTL